MKKIVYLVAAISVFSNMCFADCDFSKGITKLPDGNFEYSKECNLKVGQTVQDNAVKDQQVQDLTKAITLKDLAISDADQRAANWMNTSVKLEKNIQEMNSLKKDAEYIYFGLGALTVIGLGLASKSLNK